MKWHWMFHGIGRPQLAAFACSNTCSCGALQQYNTEPAVVEKPCCRPWTTFLPLAIVLGVAMIKEAVEDYKRYRQDATVNNAKVQVTGRAEKEAWQTLSKNAVGTAQCAGRICLDRTCSDSVNFG